MRRGEIVTLTAGTGVGKTTVIKQLEEKIFKETNEKIGILSLEESTTTAALSLMSLSANKLFHLPTKKQMQDHILNDPANISKKPNLADTITVEEKEKAFTDILKNDRFVFVEHKGKQDVETVMSRIRYLAKAQDCGVVVLDHVSILVGLAQATGRSTTEAIDHVMHSLRSVVEETNILLLNICHLSKAGQGRESAEEGGRVKLGDMRGSQAIAQLSNIAIALEANRQHDDPEKRNLTYLRALKNRFSGETGLAGVLKYDSATGRLNEIEQEEVNMEDAL
jgi:twinkle protein